MQIRIVAGVVAKDEAEAEADTVDIAQSLRRTDSLDAS